MPATVAAHWRALIAAAIQLSDCTHQVGTRTHQQPPFRIKAHIPTSCIHAGTHFQIATAMPFSIPTQPDLRRQNHRLKNPRQVGIDRNTHRIEPGIRIHFMRLLNGFQLILR